MPNSGNTHPATIDAKTQELVAPIQAIQQRRRRATDQLTPTLPFWPDEKRGAPNAFLRTALFAAVQGKHRQWFAKMTPIASQSGITLFCMGNQLNQDDLNVFEAIVHRHQGSPLGTVCAFTAYELLKLMDLSDGSSQRKQLEQCIHRLANTTIQLTVGTVSYFGHLLNRGTKDEATRRWDIELNEGLVKLFSDDQWTAINWEQRKRFRGKPLALALHSYYSTHRKPFGVKVQTLFDLTGSQNKSMRGFKQKLKEGLEELVKAKFIKSFHIDPDTHIVSVDKF